MVLDLKYSEREPIFQVARHLSTRIYAGKNVSHVFVPIYTLRSHPASSSWMWMVTLTFPSAALFLARSARSLLASSSSLLASAMLSIAACL